MCSNSLYCRRNIKRHLKNFQDDRIDELEESFEELKSTKALIIKINHLLNNLMKNMPQELQSDLIDYCDLTILLKIKTEEFFYKYGMQDGINLTYLDLSKIKVI